MKRWWEYPLYILVVGSAKLFGSLPHEHGITLGNALGRLLFRLHGRYRIIALENLRNAYPDKQERECRQIATRVFENLGKILYEICWSTTMSNRELGKQVRIEGMRHIKTAYAKNRGVLVLTAHFGNWELLSIVGKKIGYPLSVVYRPLDFTPLERFIIGLRTRFGGHLIPKKKGLRKILRSLGRKQLVGILLDQNVAMREGVFAPFFNRPACTNKGLALLALKSGAPVVPIFLLREKNGYRGIIKPEVPLVRTGDKTKDVEINTGAYNQAIEEMVRRYPEQWFWVHRRWNTRPYCPWPRV
jgi:KDO2-lipid IV(A) lauroyltransferase